MTSQSIIYLPSAYVFQAGAQFIFHLPQGAARDINGCLQACEFSFDIHIRHLPSSGHTGNWCMGTESSAIGSCAESTA
jgi:hypothetical protein